MRRPDVFTLDYAHPLAQGLVILYLPSMDSRQDKISLFHTPKNSKDLNLVNVSKVADELVFAPGENSKILIGDYSNFIPWGAFSFAAHGTVRNAANRNQKIFGSFTGRQASFEVDNVGPIYLRLWSGNHAHWVRNDLYSGKSSFAITRNLGYSRFFVDGVVKNSVSNGSTGTTGFANLHMGSVNADADAANMRLSAYAFWNRELSIAEVEMFSDRTDPMLGGLVKEHWPTVYFDMGSTPGTPIPAPTGLYGIAQTQAITWYWTPGE